MFFTTTSQNFARKGRQQLEKPGVPQQVVTKLLQNLRPRSATGEPKRITPLRARMVSNTAADVQVDRRVEGLLLKSRAPRGRP